MSDRTDDDLRADLQLSLPTWAGGSPDEPVIRVLRAVGPLLDRAQRAEAEVERLTRQSVEDADALEVYAVARDQALADLAHLREKTEQLRVQVARVEALIPGDGSVYVVTTAQLREALGARRDDFLVIPMSVVSTPEPPTSVEHEWDVTQPPTACRHCGVEYNSGRWVNCPGPAPEPPTKPEARQWCSDDQTCDGRCGGTSWAHIVAWVNANGGEARYEPANGTPGGIAYTPARIALRRADGNEAFAHPGDWIVKGERVTVTGREGRAPGLYKLRDFFRSKEQPTTEETTT